MAERSDGPESRETLDQASPAATAVALGRTGKGGKAMDLSKPDRAALEVLLARTAAGPLRV